MNAEREAARHSLYFEVTHNLVIETTRLGIEVKNLKMRVESLDEPARIQRTPRARPRKRRGLQERRRNAKRPRPPARRQPPPSAAAVARRVCPHPSMAPREAQSQPGSRAGRAWPAQPPPPAATRPARRRARRRRRWELPPTPAPTAPDAEHSEAESSEAGRRNAERARPGTTMTRRRPFAGALPDQWNTESPLRRIRASRNRKAGLIRPDIDDAVKLAVVVQRYGQAINGGAELHARYIAEHLAQPRRGRGPDDVRHRLRHVAERAGPRRRDGQRHARPAVSRQARARSPSYSPAAPTGCSNTGTRSPTSWTGSTPKGPTARR